MCNVSGLVAEQRSPKGRIHNPLKGEESQRGSGGHLLWDEKQSLCEALPLCDQFLSLFHISSLSSRRQIEMKAAMSWPLWNSSGLHEQRLAASRQPCVYGSIILCDSVWSLTLYRYGSVPHETRRTCFDLSRTTCFCLALCSFTAVLPLPYFVTPVCCFYWRVVRNSGIYMQS